MGEIKPSLFADDLIIYAEIPKDSTKKWLGVISNYYKVSEVNTHKTTNSYISYIPTMDNWNLELKHNSI